MCCGSALGRVSDAKTRRSGCARLPFAMMGLGPRSDREWTEWTENKGGFQSPRPADPSVPALRTSFPRLVTADRLLKSIVVMEFMKQNGYVPTITEYRHGKTLVMQRPYDDRSSRYVREHQWMGDSNPDRRQSAMSLNRKNASQQVRSSSGVVPLKSTTTTRTTSSSSRPKPRLRHRSPPPAEELVEQWNKRSQLDDTESSEDDGNARLLGLSGTSKGFGHAGNASDIKGKNSFIQRIRLTVSPEACMNRLPLTSRGTSRPEMDPDDDNKYWHFSQDGTAISASSPRKNVRVEVSIGLGDGDSIASPSSVEAFPHPPRRSVSGKKKKQLRLSAPSDVNNDADCRRKCFSFGEENGVVRMGESDESSEDDFVMMDRNSRKGKGKEVVGSKKVDEREFFPPKTKGFEGKKNARQEEPSTFSRSDIQAKSKLPKTDLLKVNSAKRANDTSNKQRVVPSPAKRLPALIKNSKPKRVRLGEDSELERLESDLSDTPRPVKKKYRDIANPGHASGKPSARRERTPPPTSSATGMKRKRPFEDDPTDFFSGLDTSSRVAPRKNQATVLPRTPEKDLTGLKRKRPQEREKDAVITKEKAVTMKEKDGTSIKDKSSRVASPKGFPAPMRAPVRVNEALLSSPQPGSGSQSEQPKKRYRRNSAGIEEEIALGPNG